VRLGSAALATERVERKLAAILAADVAGYSRLMGSDEEGTLARLKALRRELADPKIKEHRWEGNKGNCKRGQSAKCSPGTQGA
jgi:class 3 adenylate cyclase